MAGVGIAVGFTGWMIWRGREASVIAASPEAAQAAISAAAQRRSEEERAIMQAHRARWQAMQQDAAASKPAPGQSKD